MLSLLTQTIVRAYVRLKNVYEMTLKDFTNSNVNRQ